jgi:biotin carboxyl carrier protein
MSDAGNDLSTVPDNPEQLDQAVRTTTVRGWIGLGIAAFAVVVALVLSFVVTIPRQVTATAVVNNPDAVHDVVAGAAGSVIVEVASGDTVRDGEEVAQLTTFAGGTRRIDAPVGGLVRDVVVNQGQGVEPADTILTISNAKAPAHPRLTTFLPESEAVLYRKGAEVTVELEDPGGAGTTYVPAKVNYVADVPSPLVAMGVAMQSIDLARQLHSAAGEAAYRVELSIEEGLGSETIEGQVATVTNTYDRQHPIELLFGDSSE